MNQGGFDIMAFLPLVLIFGIFYFFLIRPQQKKMKEQQAMLAAIRRGDKIVTNGGVIGTVSRLTSDKELLVEIADNVKVRVLRAMVADVLAKTEAVNSDEPKSLDSKSSDVKIEKKKAAAKKGSSKAVSKTSSKEPIKAALAPEAESLAEKD
jgi:preprotein translocase subunit YajC